MRAKQCPSTPVQTQDIVPAEQQANVYSQSQVPLLQMSSHCIALIESFATAWAFPHAVGDTVLHALVAKDMTARLQDGVLEVDSAHRANDKVLQTMSVTNP
jgi:hypothetical protein